MTVMKALDRADLAAKRNTPVGYSYWRWWIIRPALCKHTLGWFFRHWAVRTGHLILE